MRIYLDTGPLVALLNRRDAFHSWSVEQSGKLEPPFYTCEAVVTEAHYLLGGIRHGNRRLIDLLGSGKFIFPSTVSKNLDRIGELMIKFATVPMSFADACLVCMAEQHDGAIFTLDGDFHIYRKNQKDELHLLIP